MTRAEAERLDRIEAKLDEIHGYERRRLVLAGQQLEQAREHTAFLGRVLDYLTGIAATRRDAGTRGGPSQVTADARHLRVVREE